MVTKKTKIKHLHNAGISKEVNNNLMERLNGTVREREKVMRGLKKKESPIVDGQRIYYNYIRPHQALGGLTPAIIAGINLNLGYNKWKNILLQAIKHNNGKN
jgi:hypothetical protein